MVVEAWRTEYNTYRPHSSLGGLTPGGVRQEVDQTAITPIRAGSLTGVPSPPRNPRQTLFGRKADDLPVTHLSGWILASTPLGGMSTGPARA